MSRLGPQRHCATIGIKKKIKSTSLSPCTRLEGKNYFSSPVAALDLFLAAAATILWICRRHVTRPFQPSDRHDEHVAVLGTAVSTAIDTYPHHRRRHSLDPTSVFKVYFFNRRFSISTRLPTILIVKYFYSDSRVATR